MTSLSLLLLTLALAPCQAATKDVRSVVAQIGAVWNDEANLKRLHEELVSRFKDAPPLVELSGADQWVVVLDVAQAKWARSVAARSNGIGKLQKGDVVEIAYGNPAKAQSYAELPRVQRILCQAGSADYESCKQGVRFGAFDSQGVQTSWGD